ncbi:MAG: hypothetical protein RLZZ244_2477, partial [Verrucomicrobiota bacterium]
MSDFAQNQAICTLQRLNPAHLHALESDWLPPLCKPSPVSLILPCHAPDLDGPALEPLCLQLAAAPWIHQVLSPVTGLPPDLL